MHGIWMIVADSRDDFFLITSHLQCPEMLVAFPQQGLWVESWVAHHCKMTSRWRVMFGRERNLQVDLLRSYGLH